MPESKTEPFLVALDFKCPTCHVLAGKRCVTESGEETAPHAERGGPNAA